MTALSFRRGRARAKGHLPMYNVLMRCTAVFLALVFSTLCALTSSHSSGQESPWKHLKARNAKLLRNLRAFNVSFFIFLKVGEQSEYADRMKTAVELKFRQSKLPFTVVPPLSREAYSSEKPTIEIQALYQSKLPDDGKGKTLVRATMREVVKLPRNGEDVTAQVWYSPEFEVESGSEALGKIEEIAAEFCNDYLAGNPPKTAYQVFCVVHLPLLRRVATLK